MSDVERIREEGRLWVMRQRFWLFGTATYVDGSTVSFEDADKNGRRFFNALDRSLLNRQQLSTGTRLPRLVFAERGRLRINTHIHFFIKGFDFRQYHTITAEAERLWPLLIDGAADLVMKDNVASNAERAGYCWKEVWGKQCDVLLPSCCYL